VAVATHDYLTYYSVVHPERFDLDFKTFYQECSIQTSAARKEVPHVLNLAYGSDPKQRLDIYLPKVSSRNAPVLLHLHGGGFVEGDRADYGFLAPAFVKRGVIMVMASYRLVSNGFTLLDAVADAKAAIKWVYQNIARYGGDPDSIVLSGHSAGAILSANVAVDLSWLREEDIPSTVLKATVAVSGIYNFPLDFNARNDILTSPEVKIAMSAMQHIKSAAPKIIIAVGSIETGPKDNYVASSMAFCDALKSTATNVQLIVLPDKNHQETSRAVGDEKSPLFQAMCALFE
jgi:acetyl esterase/lipase